MNLNISPIVPVEDKDAKAKASKETPVMWLVGGTLVDRPFTSQGVRASLWREYAAELEPSLAREFKTFELMVRLYCSSHHGSSEPCPSCEAILANMAVRLRDCRKGAEKPVCKSCEHRCYGPSVAFQTRQIMRYAAPRMLLRHPLATVGHLWHAWRNAHAEHESA